MKCLTKYVCSRIFGRVLGHPTLGQVTSSGVMIGPRSGIVSLGTVGVDNTLLGIGQ